MINFEEHIRLILNVKYLPWFYDKDLKSYNKGQEEFLKLYSEYQILNSGIQE